MITRLFRNIVIGLTLTALTVAVGAVPVSSARSRSATNGRIAFQSARPPGDQSAPDVYTINPDGSNTAGPLTTGYTDGQPAFSPDGTKIAFSTFEFSGSPCCNSIAVMNADGSGHTKVVNGDDTHSGINGSPAWSPDGQKLAFISNFGGFISQIGIVGVDGGGLVQITFGATDSFDPAWSPDGTKIAFASNRSGNSDIYTMNTDGTNVQQLTSDSANQTQPAWSPDGTKIAYTNNQEIVVMNANGSNPVQLTNVNINQEPAWSPDGTKIAFMTDRDHDYEIYTMNADGSSQTRVTNSPNLDEHPSWGAATGAQDSTPPVVTIALSSPNGGTPDGRNGWFVSGPVKGSVTADDTASGDSNVSSLSCGPLALTESGIGTPTASGTFSIASDGVTHVSCTASDSVGNTSAPVNMDIELDAHEPDVYRNPAADSCSSPVIGGWCPGTQTAGFAASDITSGTISPCAAGGGSSCDFTRSSSTQGSAVMIPSGAVCDVAGNCNSGIAAGPFKIGPSARLHLEVIARGRDLGPPFAAAVLRVTSSSDSASIDIGTGDLMGPAGQRCPGVGPLCTGDVGIAAGSSGSAVQIETSLSPADRVPVYSGDCDGRGNSTHTFAFVRLSVDQVATCRITFVRPDVAAGSSPDSALLVTKTFETEPLRLYPNGELDLLGNSPLALATSQLSSLRDTSGSGHCPLQAPQPVCEWAVTLRGDNWSHIQPRLVETADPKWIGIFGGGCNPRGQVMADSTPDGDLFECTIQNIHLEAQSDPHPNSVLRINVDAPTDDSRPPKGAEIVVTNVAGTQFTNMLVGEMRHANGTSCPGLGAAVCTGDAGVLVKTSLHGGQTDYFVVRVSAPPRYTATFSDGCSGASNGVSSNVIQLGVGELRSCHITFQPPARHGG